jgi:glycosyltransferase involved in cell wall biosynthesis
MKTIVYLVQRFRPRFEATSKEIDLLGKHFNNSWVHDLHLDGIVSAKSTNKLLSYHFVFYPLLFPYLYLSTLFKIKHVFTSLVDFPYLQFISKKNMIVTSTNYFDREILKKRIAQLKRTHKIVVEAKVQIPELLALGIPETKIRLIYPPVDLDAFSYTKAKGKFKILNATCPTKSRDLHKRGIPLLVEAAPEVDAEFSLLWRNKKPHPINSPPNILNFHKIILDMNKVYADHHCTIVPYTKLDTELKLIPNSAIESLAAGKPILVSSTSGISEIVKVHKCGVVFEPTSAGVRAAIGELRKNYSKYQKNCRVLAERIFSEDTFLKSYESIYEEM